MLAFSSWKGASLEKTAAQVDAIDAHLALWSGLHRSSRPQRLSGETMKRILGTATLVGLAFALGVAGCQVYEFQPVSPSSVAQDARTVPLAFNRPKPNLMILEDKSGSMANAITPGGVSKMDVLKQVMGDFLTSNPTVARVGLTKFPNSSCIPSTGSDVLGDVPPGSAGDADSILTAASQAANAALQTLTPEGGTPTAGSLQFLHDNPTLVADPARENFVLLLTDGLPNCNNALDGTSCVCTSTPNNSPPCPNFDCLDNLAVVSAISGLKNERSIKTIVIGFGGDVVGGIAQTTLQAMAEAGGFVRKCPNTNQSCGANNPCNLGTALCSKQYFEATDGQALADALAEIGNSLTQESCRYTLVDVPSDPQLLSVSVNGTPFRPGPDSWRYEPPPRNQIVFQGQLCEQIQGNTPDNPVRLDVRLLKVL